MVCVCNRKAPIECGNKRDKRISNEKKKRNKTMIVRCIIEIQQKINTEQVEEEKIGDGNKITS